MKSSSKTIQMKATRVALAKLRVCYRHTNENKSNYVVKCCKYDSVIASCKGYFEHGNCALGSYCLVVTQGNHCSKFCMRKCPMRNCQFPMPKVTFIECCSLV